MDAVGIKVTELSRQSRQHLDELLLTSTNNEINNDTKKIQSKNGRLNPFLYNVSIHQNNEHNENNYNTEDNDKNENTEFIDFTALKNETNNLAESNNQNIKTTD